MPTTAQKRSHRDCPKCRQSRRKQSLHVTYYGEAEVDYCLRCKGLWFEAGELSSVQHDKAVDENCREFEASLGRFTGVSALHCPDCAEPLQQHHLIDEYTAEVGCCHSCSGVWVEREQLEEVAHAPKLKQALMAFQGETSWKTWLFQFVSQFPVEFNVRAHITPWVTYSLMVLNVLIFTLMSIAPSFLEWTLSSVALVPAEIGQGRDLQSLLGHQFLHGGWMHLIGNMYFLYVVGDNLEDALGHLRFLLLYLLCGIFGALFHFASDVDSEIFLVGASGAISGLFGMYLLWFKHARLTFMLLVFQFKLSPAIYFAIWLAINVLGIVSNSGGVAYWAHIGGFVAGLLMGQWLKPFVLKRNLVLQMLHSGNMKG